MTTGKVASHCAQDLGYSAVEFETDSLKTAMAFSKGGSEF